jgi:putative ABC transport system permease protein
LKPPGLAKRLLLLFLRDDLKEEVVGDLEENFYSERSGYKARIIYWYQVFNYMRPFALRRRKSHNANHFGMLKNYFTIGWRNMLKHKMYSAINIGGFALGIASCFVLALYIKAELSYDSFYANTDRIYRVVRITSDGEETRKGAWFPRPFDDVLVENFPEIENAGIYNPNYWLGAGEAEIRRVDRPDNAHESGLVYVDQGLVDIFELPFIAGNPLKALTEPNTIIITRSKAEKYFGNEDPIGKSIIINNDEKRVYTITGVIENFSPQSHFNYDFLMTLENNGFWDGERTSWRSSNYLNYVLVEPGTDISSLQTKLQSVVDTYMLPDAVSDRNDPGEISWLKSMRFELQPVTDVYLNTIGVEDNLTHGDIRFIWLFGSIAGFILFLAVINFINLATARSASRAKEVGIRKVVGSLRSALVRQFLTESTLFSVMAIILGVAVAALAIPAFNNITGRSLSFPWNEPWLIPTLLLASVLIGILAGLYPSFYLSSFKPAQMRLDPNKKATLRSALVVFQFAISTILIIGTIVVNNQMNYLLNKKLGFDKDHVLLLEGTQTLGDKAQPFKAELVQLADVRSATISNYLPVEGRRRNWGQHYFPGTADNKGVGSQQWSVDQDYIKTLGLNLVAGRDFDIGIASDSDAMIINETLARKLNLTDPVGRQIQNAFGVFNVVGVVQDFHIESLKEEIIPVSLMLRGNPQTIAVKVSGNNMASTVGAITAVWKKFSPHQPIRISFLDDEYAQTYRDVMRFQTVITVFATLAIVVACLGLFGLSSFMIEQRSREISIRMVLGAPVSSILRLLSQNFVMLVGIAFVVASPIAWLMMNRWLEDYAYKINITWHVFAVTGVSAVALALFTIGYQSIKASMTSPVANLKSE